MPPSNPRAACVHALQQWESGTAFADEMLHHTLADSRLSALDRALLTELFYGILRRRRALDFLIGLLRDGEIDPATRQVLRLGFYQLFWMRTPPHAAVNETVNLAGRARGLVNALLRRALREKTALEERLAAAPLPVRTSHPDFLVQRWERQFGPAQTERLCEWNNTPAEIYVRANALKTTPEALLAAASEVQPTPLHPRALKVRQVPLQWLADGLCYVQDPSTLMAVDLLDPQPGETVLDACAAPGGKTSYIAELMRNEGRIIAADASRSRLERMRDNLLRLGVTCALPMRADWSLHVPLAPESFDRILVDAPCSNTGVIRRRVDVRWRLAPEDFREMPPRQRGILDALAPLLRPGGTMVYSTCSLEPEENEQVAEAFCRETPGFELKEIRRRRPQDDGTDGAFAAKIVKT